MQSFHSLIPLLFLLACLWNLPTHAQSPTYFFYFSETEITRFNESIPWLPSEFGRNNVISAPIGTNNSFDFGGENGHFLKEVYAYTGISGAENCRFNRNVYRNIQIQNLFNTIQNILFRADFTAYGFRNEYITRIKFYSDNDSGMIEVHQYPSGLEYRDSLIFEIHNPQDYIIAVQGDCEIEGTLSGTCTIGCTGDMWLVGDIKYNGADEYGRFGDTPLEMAEMQHTLGLASIGNIIIKNTLANGRNNGISEGQDRLDRHSIVVNAALSCNGSFTFENQNDEHDLYQGTTPDERGTIYLTGSIAQHRRDYFHRDNNEGTGYSTDFMFDTRFEDRPPFGFLYQYLVIEGSHESLTLSNSNYYFQDATVQTLRIDPGAILHLSGRRSLTVTDTLIALGTVTDSIKFLGGNGRNFYEIILGTHQNSVIDLAYSVFERYAELQIMGNNLSLKNLLIQSELWIEGTVTIDSSLINEHCTIYGWDEVQVSRSLIKNGLELSGNPDHTLITNNTIVESQYAGILLHESSDVLIKNNLISFNRDGIVNFDHSQPSITFCNIFNNRDDDYLNCEPGEGTTSIDPLFIDQQREDFHLWFNSPCLDAGDPDSPLDPDGSRADIGAYFIDKRLEITARDANPREFTCTAFPNPFNSSTTIEFRVGSDSNPTSLSIYDLSGRLVNGLVNGTVPPGNHSLVWEANDVPAGIYLIVLNDGTKQAVQKVALVR